VKVRKVFGTETTDYLDGFQYTNSVLKFFPTAEGYFNVETGKYVYNYTDHLGNVRLSYAKSGAGTEIIEESNYYPFGLKHEGYNALTGNPAYKYKYNGKELQESGMYDYGARIYMPDIGRWGVVDPKGAEFPGWSPYSYSLNNPIRFIDPDGMAPNDIVFINNRGVEVHRIKSDTQFKTYIQESTNASNNPAQSTAGWKSVPMPNIIQHRPQSNEDVSGAAYQENDYQIAARTGYFNQAKNSGQLNLVTEGGNSIPTEATKGIPDLDPTLVKAVTVQESNAGTTGITDIMQANVPGDWSKMKSSYQLTKGEKTNETKSLYAGTRVLATKGFKGGVSVDSKTGKATYKFQGWAKAVEAYNGGGTAGYQKSVLQMQQESKKPKPSDY
jgi:RHS repeat-associated protein